MPEFERAETAGEIAQKIYEVSTDCLMAHSIRGVERYLRETYGFDTAIVLVASKDVLTDTGRLSWCSVAANTGDPSYIYYQSENPNWEKNKKRFCIAHELYHVIWGVGTANTIRRNDRTAEELCDIFANDLCLKHDTFYADPANIASLRFNGVRYRTV